MNTKYIQFFCNIKNFIEKCQEKSHALAWWYELVLKFHKKQKLKNKNYKYNIDIEGQRIFNSTVGNTESLVQYTSKPIDTGLKANLESELLSNPSIEGPLL